MFEVEIKARCYDKDSFIEKIVSAGAIHIETREEVDIYFDHPQRDFSQTDEALRLRRVGDKTCLTYKGPKVSIKSKARLEEEVCVEDFDSIKNILLLVGFTESEKVVKLRLIYNYGKIEISIDAVEKLGNFVELEIKSDNTQEAEEELFHTANLFGLTDFIQKSYLEMILDGSQPH